ncbi:glycosyltransferase [Salibacteraceae bacterium]|nr:glycosyltransferase [Salibacteraceae bacterium]
MIYHTNKIDTSFTINDILAFHFLGIHLIVLYEQDNEVPKEISEKATFIKLAESLPRLSISLLIKHIFQFILFVISISFGDWGKIITRNGIIEVLINFQNAIYKIDSLSADQMEMIRKESNILSFWFYDAQFAIQLKKKVYLQSITARSHRGDTYEGSIGVRELWLRNYQLKHIDHLYPISEDAASFIRNLYPSFQNKVSCLYLGSFKYFDQKNTLTKGAKKIFVSCSWLNNKKNVHQIPELLSHLKFNFHWYHFGSGPHEWEQKVNDSIEKFGLIDKCTLMGKTENKQIQKFYSENNIDAFISLSSTEGVPVSFMEAISYGITVFATNVGGNREIVNDTTGKLVKLETPIKEIADSLSELISTDNENKKASRIVFWENHFNILSNNKSLLN